MRYMRNIAITTILAGAILVILGLLMLAAAGRELSWRLPGDIHLRGRNWSFHFPIATCVVISLLLTALLNIIGRFLRR